MLFISRGCPAQRPAWRQPLHREEGFPDFTMSSNDPTQQRIADRQIR
jgi:hypothetical protein